MATTKFRLGFSVGAFATLGIIDLLAIQPEILFSRLGGNFIDSSETWYDYANGIEIPVLLKLRLKIGSVRLCAFAGAEGLVRVGDWGFELKDNSSRTVIDAGTYISQFIRGFIIGVPVGVGIEIPSGRGWVTIDARYLIGIQNWFLDDSPIKDWKQNAIQLLIGYGISVGAGPRSRIR